MMNGIKAWPIACGALLAGSLLPWAAPAYAAPIRKARAACAIAEARVAAQNRYPISHFASCEMLDAVDSPRGYYVLALRAWCHQDICGSTLIGWYAVQKATGRVFEYDVAELKVAAPVGSPR